MERDLRTFIEKHVEKIAPLRKIMTTAYWDATVTGDKGKYEEYAKYQLQLRSVYANADEFELVKKFKDEAEIYDPILKRQLMLLYDEYLENQIPPDLMKELVQKSSEIESRFSTFRGSIDGKTYTDNELKEILKVSKDHELRQKAWEATKQIGAEVADDVIHLTKLRNEAARQLGFDNYFMMSLMLSEQVVSEIFTIFDELKSLTDVPFQNAKVEIDSILAERYSISSEEIQPWHYEDPFFQEVPQMTEINFDSYFKDQNIEKLSYDFYKSIGLEVSDILERSSLYEQPNKYQHAYCLDIDHFGDVRVLANIKPDEQWMETMLHELGHAVYDKYLDSELPYLLRMPSHIFTTEAVAMFFGRLSKNADWMQNMLGVSDKNKQSIETTIMQESRLRQLVFSRWCQVILRFEQSFYNNPEQDLNNLWQELVEAYQKVTLPKERNAPDWAAKIHIALYPAYYHNYMLGELMASQLLHTINTTILNNPADLNGFVGNKQVGEFFVENVFKPGARLRWDALVEYATNEPLTPKYFVDQFVQNP